MPYSNVDVASLEKFGSRWTLQRNLRSVNVEVALQGPLRGFERLVNESVEFDILQIGTSPAANEVEVLAVALAAIAKAQSGPALKDNVPEDACFGQRGQQMKVDGFLHQILSHARFDPAALDKGVDRALKPARFTAHPGSLPPT